MITHHREDGSSVVVHQGPHASVEDLKTYATKVFLRDRSVRSVVADVMMRCAVTLDDDANIVVSPIAGSTPAVAINTPSASVTYSQPPAQVVQAPVPLPPSIPESINVPPPPSGPPKTLIETLAGERRHLEEDSKRLGIELYEPNEEERKQRVSIVAFYRQPQPMLYSPMGDVNQALPKKSPLTALGYKNVTTPGAPGGTLMMLICRTNNGKMVMIPEMDVIAAPLSDKRKVGGGAGAPDAAPLQYMEDGEGNVAVEANTVEITDANGVKRTVLNGNIPDKITLTMG